MTLHVLSGGAAKGVVAALRPAFEKQTGAEVDGTFGAVGMMKDALLAGAPCDVIILTAALIDGLVADGHAVAGTAAALGRVATGIAVPTGDAAPDVSDGPALAAALKAARAIYIPDPVKSTAGIHVVDMLRRLGIHDEVAPYIKPFPNGATAMAAMAKERAPNSIGCTQVTEILYTEGVTLTAPLPEGFGLETIYTAGVASRTADEGRARRFVELLSGPSSAEIRRSGGFTF
jgi:molybdate transport system substrate-binding protein